MAHLARHPPEATAAIAAVLQAKDREHTFSIEWEEPPLEWSWGEELESLL